MNIKWICPHCGDGQSEEKPKTYCLNCHKGRYQEWHQCECGKWFHPDRLSKKYCSQECRYKYMPKGGKKGKHYPHTQRARTAICPVCGKEFRAIHDYKNRQTIYCSKECWSKRATENRECPICGKKFQTSTKRNKIYCSNECRNLAYRERKGEQSHFWQGGTRKEKLGDEPSGIFNRRSDYVPQKTRGGYLMTEGSKHVSLSGILNDYDPTTYAKNGKLFKHNDIKFEDWLPEVYRVLKQNTHCYIMINPRNLAELQTKAEKVGFKFQQILIWAKNNSTPNKYYLNSYEMILMLRKGKAKNINHMGTKNILQINNIIGNKKHPTEKPVELMEILIDNSTRGGDVVLDPFMGSGSTGVACKKLGRDFIGMEIDEKYFKIAEERINEVDKVDLSCLD